MKHVIIIVMVLFMVGLTSPSFADYLGQQFRDMDLNQDEKITWPEYKDYMLRALTADFRAADLNRDDGIELYEWITYQNDQHPELAEKSYRYRNRNGHRFKLTNGNWYKEPQDGFRYRYQDGIWVRDSRRGNCWYRRCGWDWNAPWPCDDYYEYRYRIGLSYGVRF